MDKNLNPNKIYEDFKKNKINKFETLKILESLINESDNEDIRAQAINLIGKLSLFNERISRIIEKSIITDESTLVKINAAKISLRNNLDQTEKALDWLIENEKSILFFKKMLDFTEQSQNPKLKIFHEKLLKKLEKIYNLNKQEARFILELDYLDYEKFIETFREFSSKFEIKETEKKKLFKENTEIGFKGLGRIKSIRERCITGLVLDGFDRLPKSLQCLSKLENLVIKRSKIGNLPDKYGYLSNLKNFVLQNNQIETIPKWVLTIASKDYYIKKYIKSGVNAKEVSLLGLLEILTGQAFIRLDLDVFPSHSLLFYYKTNKVGNITTLYLSSELSRIGIFPKELCKLKFLEEICMVNQNIRFIPECIGDLRNLKILNLNYNEISELPASIGNLEKLEYLCLRKDGGKLSIIPKNLVNLKNLKVLDLTGNTVENMPESIKSLDSLKI
ncbi:MAG: leucine-rich repeat domain-containing protein [Promethearchaeota archaeon]